MLYGRLTCQWLAVVSSPNGFSMRAGVETGQAVVGGLLGGSPHFGAFGQVVVTAAALQSMAKSASVLVARPPMLLPHGYLIGARQRR